MMEKMAPTWKSRAIKANSRLCFLEQACPVVEGGMYLAPEFLLGQVYDGNEHHLR